MKLKLTFLILIISILSAKAQKEEKQEIVKQGWNFGALPAIAFDSDLGFQYGGLINLYHYGDGSRYPEYNHSFYLEISRFTKGSGVYQFQYDSDRLLKGIQTVADLSYLTDLTYQFYGFNGYDAVYNEDWLDEDHPDYRSRVFYNYDRKLFRFKVDLQGPLAQSNFKWEAGINFQKFKLASVNINKLNKGKDEVDKLPDIAGLYNIYQQWGLVGSEEANGGNIPALRGGLIYDSRDFRAIPGKGIWSEAVLEYVPKILGAESSFTRLGITHRQYFTIVSKKLIFAYRLSYEATLSGNVPFYYLTKRVVDGAKGNSMEGLGGGRTMRGVLRNRVIGDDVAFGNFELRSRIWNFQYKNNNFFVGLNGFIDTGKVTGKHALNFYPSFAAVDTEGYLDYNSEEWHTSYGLGIKAGMNENFVVSCDYGRVTDDRDGSSGLYIKLNYLF
ncbi:Omp85 family outer membrane protein [Mangrovibacterium diazotrophicum]|uniref:Surface antigen-like protein n=1 Tax=Mangrovibacterium diazotrophicum TaxID=1261403 RepID=A0A419VWN1_9BACT|nr:BamA/TamA family outer membrane protein [Mangrovibacterium diazotrophicum]RKD86518.1 surface antigen-like protein [Mangrovibacterium diazotrophicum]